MAIQDTDLLVAYRPANETHYKLSLADLPSSDLPNGTDFGQILEWNGGDWIAVDFPIPDGTAEGDYLEWNGSNWIARPHTDVLPDGTAPGQLLEWTGDQWVPTNAIDGGTY